MAFDEPLESDRVDDLNLFSVFIRAPVVGTLMWILGGESARRADEDARKRESDGAMLLDGALSSSSMRRMQKDQGLKTMNKTMPSLVGSEISDVGECVESFADMQLEEERFRSHRTFGLTENPDRQLSWSDESGHDLVNYGNESLRYEPRRDLEPAKPALSRSRSVKSNANRMEGDDNEARYLPRGLRRNDSNGPVAPTMQYTGVNVASSGIESPQWGWYINTTPPTPEMYYSSKSQKHHASSSSADFSHTSAGTTSSSSSAGASVPVVGQSNPVFEGLRNKKKTGPMDWPAVPI